MPRIEQALKTKSPPLPRKDAFFRSEIWNTSAAKPALALLAQHRAHKYRSHQQMRSIYRFIESLRLEETSKIFNSNHSPSTAKSSTNPCPYTAHLHIFFNTSRNFNSTTSLGSLFQCLTTLS